MKNNKKIKVPTIYPDFSSQRVLTMDYITGVKMDNLAVLKKQKINHKKLVLTYFTSILEQALIHGFFHADPHPGNIFIQKNGDLVYLDFGIMGELSVNLRKRIVHFINTLPDKDAEKSMDIIISMAKDTTNANLDEFKQEALPILKEIYYESISKKSFGYALYQIIGIGARYKVIFDPNLVLIAKAIYQAEGLGIKLDPDFKVSEGIDLFSKTYIKEKYSVTKILSTAKHKWLSNRDLIVDLPDHIIKIVERLEKEPKAAHCEADHLSHLENRLIGMYRRRNFSIIIAALILGSVFLFKKEGRIFLLGIPLDTAFLTLAILLLILFIFSLKKKKEAN